MMNEEWARGVRDTGESGLIPGFSLTGDLGRPIDEVTHLPCLSLLGVDAFNGRVFLCLGGVSDEAEGCKR